MPKKVRKSRKGAPIESPYTTDCDGCGCGQPNCQTCASGWLIDDLTRKSPPQPSEDNEADDQSESDINHISDSDFEEEEHEASGEIRLHGFEGPTQAEMGEIEDIISGLDEKALREVVTDLAKNDLTGGIVMYFEAYKLQQQGDKPKTSASGFGGISGPAKDDNGISRKRQRVDYESEPSRVAHNERS